MSKFTLSDNTKHVHFIGIGGISMSAIARLLAERGFTVSGSDMKESSITRDLADLGIKISYPQAAANITSDIDVIVYTSAIHPDNPEFIAAKESGAAMYQRAELLGLIMKHYKNAIAVAGTHGKTTTTSMLSYIYLEGNTDPTVFVGGILPGIGGNMRAGKSEHFVAEACEYTDSFLHFYPTTEIILNIEPEHLDYFKDLAAERISFSKFINLLPDKEGILVINKKIDDIESLTEGKDIKVITYSLNEDADYRASSISYNEKGFGSYDLYVRGEKLGRVSLSVAGDHNISNSLAAIAASMEHGIGFEACAAALKKYTGTDRRLQLKGTFNKAVIYDDYAHHPSEIKATLDACTRIAHKRLIVAFQPHLYSRTKFFLPDFIKVLSAADKVLLADIYAAREKDPGDISSKDIADGINKGSDSEKALYLGKFEKIKNFLINNLKEGDLLITMGAGDIVTVGEKLIQ